MRLDCSTFHVLVLAGASCLLAACNAQDAPMAPRLQNMGNLDFPISSRNPQTKRFFNQGLTFVYAFNHYEADRAFREAARLDPECAICYWGQALALGPNINDPVPDDEREAKAYEAVEQAKKLQAGGAKEQALILALSARHPSPKPDKETRGKAYADAMAAVYEKFPDDPDVGTLYAAALMDTTPWDYWVEGKSLKPEIAPLSGVLESAIRSHPDHAGANHYYIHVMEASDDPDLAVASADRLGNLVPIAGHLVHMPAHIYIRVGRYRDASLANVKASEADEDYITQCRVQGMYPATYYPHNVHFLWAALTMEGRGAEAIEVARKAATRHTEEHFHIDGLAAFPHLLRAVPLFALTRFGKWDELFAEPEPEQDKVFARAVWRFGRGMAFRAGGDAEKARAELEQLRSLASDPSLEKLAIYGSNSLAQLGRIAVLMLEGELDAMRGDVDAAAAKLSEAIAIDDGLVYSEPRDWPQPPRHSLGAILLEAGRAAEAEKVYQADLRVHRDNGWSLFGLWKSLAAQGKTEAAAEVKGRFEKAWSGADLVLTSSRL